MKNELLAMVVDSAQEADRERKAMKLRVASRFSRENRAPAGFGASKIEKQMAGVVALYNAFEL